LFIAKNDAGLLPDISPHRGAPAARPRDDIALGTVRAERKASRGTVRVCTVRAFCARSKVPHFCCKCTNVMEAIARTMRSSKLSSMCSTRAATIVANFPPLKLRTIRPMQSVLMLKRNQAQNSSEGSRQRQHAVSGDNGDGSVSPVLAHDDELVRACGAAEAHFALEAMTRASVGRLVGGATRRR
jgi:hypothetical protein